MTIEVELPDGTVLDIETDDQAVAAAAAQKYLAANAPPTSGVQNGGFLDRLSGRYNREVDEGLQGAAEGIEKLTRPNNTMGGRMLGAGQAALGGMQYAASPLTAAAGAIAGDPTRLAMDQAGAPQMATDMVGNAAEFGAGMLGGQPVLQAGKAVAREAAPILNALSRTATRSSDEILDASKSAYKRAESAGAVVKPEAFSEFVASTKARLRNEGYMPKLHDKVAPVLDELEGFAANGTQKNFQDLENMRRMANQSIMASADDANRAKAYAVRNAIDDFTGNVQPHQMVAGDAKEASAAWKEGRDLYRQQARMKDIEDVFDVAKRQEDPDKFIRQQFTRISKNNDEFKTYTKEQRALIEKIANRGPIESWVSHLSPGNGRNLTQLLKSMIGGGVGFAVAGPAGAVVLPAAGALVEQASKMRRVGNVNELTESIARGSAPGYMERLAQERAASRGLGGR